MNSEPPAASRATVIGMLGLDAALIVIFAMFGIASHDGSLNFFGIARVALPFLLPYVVLTALIKPSRYIHNVFPVGVVLWLVTVALGPVLRAVLFNDTSAMAFVLVTAGVLGVLLLGRRSISHLVTRRRENA
ncbi:hypothetical protein GCM10023190_03440 [Enteractinococcus fodinae]|uniref:DUF3054 domain-containing protein n=1 Tax=Enteractinococcus fodinae TaxID=684663 RepID=A0ABU2B2Z9_9MICC|nr:DUF3054 domain-containing protein [Enteractinococcus fodinae]MDR7347178.1 hypothetical protein [Enteractinococcus fodinae]